jgi:glycosyltransferase involved in cell wall biosynthesis
MSKYLPVITVILPCYNAAAFIEETLHSVLNQTFVDFECLVIDDASTDQTCALVERIAAQDARVKLFRKEQNTGYTESLNMGIGLARGRYIARMDADDICMPQRFEKQVAFMEANPGCVMCGSAYRLIHNNHTVQGPVTHSDIMLGLLYGNVFCHPSVMIRNEILRKNNIRYDTRYEPSEDYSMWVHLSNFGTLANLPDVLLAYRLHPESVSNSRSLVQKKLADEIRMSIIQKQIKIFSGERIHKLNRFWFSVVLLLESVFNNSIPTKVAFRKVIGNRHKIFS